MQAGWPRFCGARYFAGVPQKTLVLLRQQIQMLCARPPEPERPELLRLQPAQSRRPRPQFQHTAKLCKNR